MRPYPSGPKGVPVLGSLLPFRRDMRAFFTDCARTYGDFVPLRLGPMQVFLVTHPDLLETVLVTDHKSYTKGDALAGNRRLFGNGLLVSEGDFWRRQRRLAVPAFHRERILEYGQIMAARAVELRDRWKDGEIRDVHTDMMRLTLAVVVETLFGTGLSVEPETVGDALHEVQYAAEKRIQSFYPFPESLPTPANRRMGRAVRRMNTVLDALIARHRSHRTPDDKTLLSLLLDAQDEDDGSRMTAEQLRDEARTIFLAGHETTALALTFALYLLAQNPDAEAKLHAELDTVLQGRPPAAADRAVLPYTEAVLLEAMRLYPPAWTLVRKAACDTTLDGWKIPKGATMVLCQWVLHRDARWFDAPEEFRPERWQDDLQKRLPRHVYFPFGGGPRLCIGNTFAMMEGVLILAALAQPFSFRLLTATPLRLQSTITLRPRDGLSLKLCRRQPQKATPKIRSESSG